jgi:putative ABC transport system permease protein
MYWIALRMLTGDRNKYIVLVMGVAFAALLMAHQMSVFWGVMCRTTNLIWDVHPEGIWVMNPMTQYVDENKSLPAIDLYRVRGVAGVAWAVPLTRHIVRTQTETGEYRYALLIGVEDASLAGVPREMVQGAAIDLDRPDGVLVDDAGYHYLWPDQPYELGRELVINERRAALVGICKAAPPFQTMPVMYARLEQAARFAPLERERIAFVLVQPCDGVAADVVCRRIGAQTGLLALTGREFARRTIVYYFRHTGIPLNFLVVVAIGFVVGVAVAGQTFYLFTVENLKQFAMLKAMGMTNAELVRMILLQAVVVGVIGLGIGAGLATILIEQLTRNVYHLGGFYLPWQVMLFTAVAILVIMVLSSVVSIRRVIVLEPAVVFRG